MFISGFRRLMCHRGDTRLTRAAGTGFTLVELLAVLVIILILATIAFRVAAYALRKSKGSRAESDLRRLAAAADEMKARSGDYCGSGFGLSFLIWDTPDANVEGLRLTDPWGQKYGYAAINVFTGLAAMQSNQVERVLNNNVEDSQLLRQRYQEFVVWSKGPDMAPGVKGVDEDNAYGVDDDGAYNWRSAGEIGYGDDIVIGNTTTKRGFRVQGY